MGETTDAIRQDIDNQRHQLEDNLQGIEQKFKQTSEQVTDKVEHAQERVKNATDWRHQFNERPLLGVGIAFGGGVLLASMLGGGDSNKNRNSQGYAYAYQPQYQGSQHQGDGHAGADVGRQHVASTFDNIKGALMGVAAAQAKSYLEKSVPGFDKEYSQVENQSDSGDTQQSGSSHAGSYPTQNSGAI